MEKGNKVLIKNTDTIWDGKHGTVIAEEDGQVEVRINFETEDGTKQVIEIFNKENLEMEREDESLNEAVNSNEKWFVSWNSREDSPFGVKGNPDRIKKELENAVEVTPIEDGKESLIWIDFKHHLAGERKVNVPADIKHKDNLEDHDKKYYWFSPDSFYTETELFDESLNESLNYEKTDDIIHKYVHLEDLDGKEIPNWNFAARIATAEDIEEGCVCELAHDLGYKVFAIEAPGFFRTVIAAKGIKAEDIEEEYTDFLQGRACIRELEWK